MNQEQQALLNVAMRQNAPTLSKQQQFARTTLRQQAKAARLSVLERRRNTTQAYREAMQALAAEYTLIKNDLELAIENRDEWLAQKSANQLIGKAEANRLGQYIAATDVL